MRPIDADALESAVRALAEKHHAQGQVEFAKMSAQFVGMVLCLGIILHTAPVVGLGWTKES